MKLAQEELTECAMANCSASLDPSVTGTVVVAADCEIICHESALNKHCYHCYYI